MACAVAYLHSDDVGIIHRDIKLANLLLTERGIERADVKLADFGLSVDLKDIKPIDKARNVQIAQWKYQTLSKQTKKHIEAWMSSPAPTAKRPTVKNLARWASSKRSSSGTDLTPGASNTHDLPLYYDLTEETGSYMYMSPEVTTSRCIADRMIECLAGVVRPPLQRES